MSAVVSRHNAITYWDSDGKSETEEMSELLAGCSRPKLHAWHESGWLVELVAALHNCRRMRTSVASTYSIGQDSVLR